MRKIVVPNGPVAVPPAPPPPPPPEAQVERAIERELIEYAAQPPPMNQPIGPPPPPVLELPTDFEGYVDLCKKVSRGERSDKALIWAHLAQAEGLAMVAEELANIRELLEGFVSLTEKAVKKPSKAKKGAE